MTELIIQGAVAFIATVAFALLFHLPTRQYVFAGIVGAAGWVCYLAAQQMGLSAPLSCAAATLLLAVLARVFAVRRRCPFTLFLIPGIFPLVPGAGIYYTAYYFFLGDNILFAENGELTFKTAIAIAIGIVIAMALPPWMFKPFQRRAKTK